METRKETSQNQETDQSDSERIGFKISIMKDGTTIIGDVPSKVIPVLKKIFPNDSRLEESEAELENSETPTT